MLMVVSLICCRLLRFESFHGGVEILSACCAYRAQLRHVRNHQSGNYSSLPDQIANMVHVGGRSIPTAAPVTLAMTRAGIQARTEKQTCSIFMAVSFGTN
jgi:hypothetical protein